MPPHNNRKFLTIIVLALTLFALGVMLWYFFFYTPKKTGDVVPPTGGLPFGISLPPRFNFIFNDTQNNTTETEVTPGKEQALVRIWDKPASGNTIVSIPVLREIEATTTSSVKPISATATPEIITIKKIIRSTSTVLMFVDRTTGYVYGYSKETGTTHQITNTTIPGVYDAYIFNAGKSVIIRYIDNADVDNKTITTILASIPQVSEGETPLPLMNTTLLPKNVSSIAVNQSRTKVSYVVPSTSGGVIYTLTPKGAALVNTSTFSEWTVSYGGDVLYATSKPSSYVEGSVVQLPFFTRMDSKRTGLLSTISPSGTMVSSMWGQSGLITFLSTRGVVNVLAIKTLAPKCVWLHVSPIVLCAVPEILPTQTEGLPDDWYQGRYLFSDSLQFIDGTNGSIYPLYTFEEKDGPMDVTSITLSDDNKDVTFIRKQDATLWLLKTDVLTNSQ